MKAQLKVLFKAHRSLLRENKDLQKARAVKEPSEQVQVILLYIYVCHFPALLTHMPSFLLLLLLHKFKTFMILVTDASNKGKMANCRQNAEVFQPNGLDLNNRLAGTV